MTNTVTTAVRTGSGFARLNQVVLRVYSKDIEFQAQPLLRFDQFAEVKTDLSKAPGDGITFFKYNNLTRGGALVEGTPMTTQALAGSQVTLTVTEYGNAVSVSELLLELSFDDVMSSAARLLGYDYATVMDELARDTIEAGAANTILAGTGNVTQDDLLAADILSLDEIYDAVETMETNMVPKFMNDHYVCIVDPHQVRGIRDDADWIDIAMTDPQRLYSNEIGRINDVIFIATTQVSTELNGNSLSVHNAIFLGDNAFGKAVVLPVEMRDNGVEDFRRQHSLGWYSILGYGMLNENNAIVIKTA